ncbi:MAG: hemolysin family protein [Pirellulales bacterium]|nr:hemolysin family protein [Pirellulales bacterium]
MTILLLYMILFIVASGLMALVEAAILSVSRGEVEELAQSKVVGAASLKAVTDQMTRGLVVIVIFTNTINILGPILAGRQAIAVYGDAAIGMVTAALTLGTIVFSEIIPKSIGAHYAPLIGRLTAPALRVLIYVFYPVVIALEKFTNLFKSGERRIGTEAQIRSLVTVGRKSGYIESDEGQLIHRVFVLNDRTAADIMTPQSQVIGVQANSTIRQAATQVFRHAYSRYPIFGKSPDEVVGLAMSRDVLEAVVEGRDESPVSSISKPCLIVRASMRSDMLLERFRDERVHLAVVKDGQNTVGLVTLEDVLEELVGEIEDEKDLPGDTG